MSSDASVSRNYALRASDPSQDKRGSVPAANSAAFTAARTVSSSQDKRGSVPAANRLAVIALEFFPVAESRGRLATTGIVGGWKDSTLYWPL